MSVFDSMITAPLTGFPSGTWISRIVTSFRPAPIGFTDTSSNLKSLAAAQPVVGAAPSVTASAVAVVTRSVNILHPS